jgi:hypothetical protein
VRDKVNFSEGIRSTRGLGSGGRLAPIWLSGLSQAASFGVLTTSAPKLLNNASFSADILRGMVIMQPYPLIAANSASPMPFRVSNFGNVGKEVEQLDEKSCGCGKKKRVLTGVAGRRLYDHALAWYQPTLLFRFLDHSLRVVDRCQVIDVVHSPSRV